MLVHAEQVVREYLTAEMCAREQPTVPFDLFAVEGGTAAMCYVFDSLAANRLLRPGDKVALMVPAFTPYLEIPRLDRYDYEIVEVYANAHSADGSPTWQFPDDEIDKLADPAVRALFVVNPSNPPSSCSPRRRARASPASSPRPTPASSSSPTTSTERSSKASVPSWRRSRGTSSPSTPSSKYFGATGWRLGVIAVSQTNVCDTKLAALPRLRQGAPRPALRDARRRSAQHPVRRPHGRRQPPGRAQPHRRALAPAAGADDVVRGVGDPRSRRPLQATRPGGSSLAGSFVSTKAWASRSTADPLRAGYYAEIDLQIWARNATERSSPTGSAPTTSRSTRSSGSRATPASSCCRAPGSTVRRGASACRSPTSTTTPIS